VWLLLPLAWLLARVCVIEVVLHDVHGALSQLATPASGRGDLSSSSGVSGRGSSCALAHAAHATNGSYAAAVAALARTQQPAAGGSVLSFLRLDACAQQLRAAGARLPLGSVSAAAVAAHGSDLGLSAAVVLPHLLLGVLLYSIWQHVARVRASPHQRSAQPAASDEGGAAARSHDAASSSAGGSGSAAGDFMTRPAVVLAAAKLLPLCCGLVAALAARCGLLPRIHMPSQLLQLRHPCTPLVMAAMTLLSQVGGLTCGG
jgi:hypothetical protein